mmetsp:Transcript_26783/g.78288  ORF Transcript_26783/g.78288 Transcript_26783/m.78288 type:complete len:253 (+) Transcript_26783:265-1023(+)
MLSPAATRRTRRCWRCWRRRRRRRRCRCRCLGPAPAAGEAHALRLQLGGVPRRRRVGRGVGERRRRHAVCAAHRSRLQEAQEEGSVGGAHLLAPLGRRAQGRADHAGGGRARAAAAQRGRRRGERHGAAAHSRGQLRDSAKGALAHGGQQRRRGRRVLPARPLLPRFGGELARVARQRQRRLCALQAVGGGGAGRRPAAQGAAQADRQDGQLARSRQARRLGRAVQRQARPPDEVGLADAVGRAALRPGRLP